MSETISETDMIEINNELNLASAIEASLFLAGDGLDAKYFAEKFLKTEEEVKEAIAELKQKYSGESGIHLIKYKNNYQLSTNPIYEEAIAAILAPVREKALTRAALETMAIVAYKQPITKTEIEEIRGVDSNYAIQILTQNNLVEVVGRKDTVGKPLLYATTDSFLKRFELDDIDSLPSYDELLAKIKVIETREEEKFDGEIYDSNRVN